YLSIQPVNYPTSPFSPVLCVLSERELPANAVESWVDPQSAAPSIIHADKVATQNTHTHTHTHIETHTQRHTDTLCSFYFSSLTVISLSLTQTHTYSFFHSLCIFGVS